MFILGAAFLNVSRHFHRCLEGSVAYSVGPPCGASLAHLPPPQLKPGMWARSLGPSALCAALPSASSLLFPRRARELAPSLFVSALVSVFPNTFPANPGGLQFSPEEGSVMKCGKKSLTVRAESLILT